MRIINTIRILNPKSQIPNPKSQISKQKRFGNWLFGYWLLFVIWCLVIGNLAGCIQKSNLEKAKDYVRLSKSYYQQAVDIYKQLIAKGNNLEQLHFQLGQLYYQHGNFKEAAQEFKKTRLLEAKKFLAISYYRLSNFTDALEVFSKYGFFDDEGLYYHGLTSEKLNLFDQALAVYKKIKSREFSALAFERINNIERIENVAQIKQISPQVYKIIESAPAQDMYPQAGALILSVDEKIETTAQNTQVAYLHYLIKILNERGKENFSESHIDYDSTYEKVELEYARTIRPDGTVVEVGSRHIRDVSKYLNFPLYSNARVYIISFPEITEGAVIEYKLKVYRNQLVNKKDFIIGYPVQSSEPIIQADFSVDVPETKTPNIKLLNEKYNNFGANLKPQIQKNNGRLIYSWQFKNIPQIIPESNMPPEVQINPTILISTFNSWQEVYLWWWELTKDKIKPDTAIKERVKELIKGRVLAEEKIRAIYNFCAQKIRYVAVEYGQAGYEPHYASDIFKNKYGDCKDQAVLLVTMLKEARLLAWPVLVSTKEYYNLNEDFPALFFNHSIVAVALDNKIVFLDPTAETCAFGDLPADDQDRRVLIFKDEGYKIQATPLYPAKHNLAKQLIKIKINPDESIAAERSVFPNGIYEQAQRYWFLYTPPELIEQALKEKIQDISIGSKLKDYQIKNLDNLNVPVVLNYRFSGPEYFTVAGNLRIMPQLSSLDTSIVAKDKRKFALDFDILDSKETTLELTIPENFKIQYLPESITEDSLWLKFSAEYSKNINKIYFKQITELKKNVIEEHEYSDFKAFFEALAKRIKKRIILEKLN